MSERDTYHPRHALADPEAFYLEAFKNKPKRWIVPIVGNLAVRLTKPTISFHDAKSEVEYYEQIDSNRSIALTFTHRGKTQLHDPGAAAAAVFGSAYLNTRISGINTWAAAPYMTSRKTGPIINRLGTVPVIRSQDWQKYGLEPTDKQRLKVKTSLIDHSVTHLQNPQNTLAIFPAGTKGG